jgi:hypothetical protein
MSKVKKTIGLHTKQDIDAWKKEYGDVRKFTQLDEESNTHVTYFRPPNMDDISYSQSVGEGDGMKIGAAMATTVRLGGSDEVMKAANLKHGYLKAVLELAKPITGTVEKL